MATHHTQEEGGEREGGREREGGGRREGEEMKGRAQVSWGMQTCGAHS